VEEIFVKESVGNIIKNYRKSLGLTQKELGDMIGLNQRQITLIETGKSFPLLSTMTKVTSVFGCSISDFFDSLTPQNKTIISTLIKETIDSCDVSELKQIYSIVKIIKYGS